MHVAVVVDFDGDLCRKRGFRLAANRAAAMSILASHPILPVMLAEMPSLLTVNLYSSSMPPALLLVVMAMKNSPLPKSISPSITIEDPPTSMGESGKALPPCWPRTQTVSVRPLSTSEARPASIAGPSSPSDFFGGTATIAVPFTPSWMSSRISRISEKSPSRMSNTSCDIPEVSEEEAIAVGIDVHHEIAIDVHRDCRDDHPHFGLGIDVSGKLCNPRVDLWIGRVLRLELEQTVHRDGQGRSLEVSKGDLLEP